MEKNVEEFKKEMVSKEQYNDYYSNFHNDNNDFQYLNDDYDNYQYLDDSSDGLDIES